MKVLGYLTKKRKFTSSIKHCIALSKLAYLILCCFIGQLSSRKWKFPEHRISFYIQSRAQNFLFLLVWRMEFSVWRTELPSLTSLEHRISISSQSGGQNFYLFLVWRIEFPSLFGIEHRISISFESGAQNFHLLLVWSTEFPFSFSLEDRIFSLENRISISFQSGAQNFLLYFSQFFSETSAHIMIHILIYKCAT